MKTANWGYWIVIAVCLPLSVFAEARSPNGAACNVDTTQTPEQFFGRDFHHDWKPITRQQYENGTWWKTAEIWHSSVQRSFVEMWILDDPGAGDWAQRIDYCFDRSGKTLWIDSRFNSADSDSRIERLTLNSAGTIVSRHVSCLNHDNQMRLADEKCQDSQAFPIVRNWQDFQFIDKAKRNTSH